MIRAWWTLRSPREQALLAVLGLLALATLLVLGVIAPLRAIRQADYRELHTLSLLEARLKSSPTGAAVAMRTGTASAILTESAAAAHLPIERIEPEGAQTRVVTGDAPFDQVIHWIADIEATSRLRVDQAQIERKGGPGIVRATFVVIG